MQREARHLYLALLKKDGKVLDLKTMVGYYQTYNDFRSSVYIDPDAPNVLKNNLFILRMPKFLEWAKENFYK